MRTSALRSASVALTTGFAGLSLLLAGCGSDQENADKAVTEKIAKADHQRESVDPSSLSTNPKQLDAVQTVYDAAAADASVSPVMKVVVKGRQAQLRYERAMAVMSTLRAKEMVITRSIAELNQLASQIEGSQKYVEALKAYDPAKQLDDLKSRQGEIDGSAGKDTWSVAKEINAPTVAALTKTIDALNADIEKNKADIADLHKKSADASDQAETITRKAETESGQALVDDVTKASQLRHDAAVAEAQIETLSAAQANMTAELETATAQKTAIQNASQTLVSQTQNVQDTWKAIQDQIALQKKFQQKLLTGDGDQSTPGWSDAASRGTELAAQLADAKTIREGLSSELAAAIEQFKAAAAAASSLRADMLTKSRNTADPDAPIYAQALETLNPGYYTLQEANARTALATIAGNKAIIDAQIEQLFDGYTVGSSDTAAAMKSMGITSTESVHDTSLAGLTALTDREKTGLEQPKSLADLEKLPKDQVEAEIKDVEGKFDEAVKAFPEPAGTENTAGSKDRSAATQLGKAVAQRQWAQFDISLGLSDADQHLKKADEAEAVVNPAARAAMLAPPASQPSPAGTVTPPGPSDATTQPAPQ